MTKKQSAENGNFFSRFYANHPIISHLIFIVIAALILLWMALIFLDIWTGHGKNTTVPDVRGMSYAEASNVLDAYGLTIEISDSIYDLEKRPGSIIETWPHAGSNVKPGREVYVTVVSFEPMKVQIGMPLIDVSSRQAMSYLQSLQIRNIRVINVPSQYDDLVVGAKYNGRDITPGMQIPVNGTVTLEVGSVPEEFFLDPTDSLTVVDDI